MLRAAVVLLAFTLLFVIAGGCDDGQEQACKVDLDCAAGLICRDQFCGPPSSDGGTFLDVATPPVCSNEGATCGVSDECCSRTCTNGLCVSSTPVRPPDCRGQLELCRDDCCPGLTCTSGTCR